MSSQSASSFITHAADVASFYGFRPMRDIERTVPGIDRTKGPHSFGTAAKTCSISTIQQSNEPVLAFYATPLPTHVPTTFTSKDTAEFGLHVAGSPQSLGEIVLLKTLYAILTEWGAEVARVRVNALGDRDSKARFERELFAYLRKHAADLDADCRDSLVANPLAPYTCQSDVCRQVLSDGPRAVNFLSEKSRGHFREVLEHIERLGLPYELDDLLVGDEREQRIVFTIDLAKEDPIILGSTGGRFDEYARKISNKKDSAAVSAGVFFHKKGAPRSSFTSHKSLFAPKIYFVQLGLRAKLQGLAVVDMLRQAHVPVSQSFDAKSLGTQLDSARTLGVSHLLIMGQREAIDGTVIVRSTQNSSQTIIPLTTLPRFLKNLRY